MSPKTFSIVFSFGLVLLAGTLWGQRFPRPTGGGEYGGAPAQSGPLAKDTSDIHYFYADNINLLIPFGDSLLETFQQYDPIRLRDKDYAHLGNLGTAAWPLFYQPVFRRGIDVGLHAYDLYQIKTEDIRFYKLTQAFTQAAFSQGTSQSDVMFNVRFARSFAKGIGISLESRQINNAGAYDHQRAKNSNVAAGLWYHQKDGWYDGFITFVSNAFDHENNGGISESLKDTIIPPFQIDVHLQTSLSRIANKEFAYTHYFNFNKWLNRPPKPAPKPPVLSLADSLKRNSVLVQGSVQIAQDTLVSAQKPEQDSVRIYRRNLTFYHQFAWRTETYKFFDNKPESSFYRDFQVDDRGLRIYIEAKKLENSFKLMTFKLRQDGKAVVEGDLLEVGLVHSLHLIRQEPLELHTWNNLFLTGKLKVFAGKRLSLDSYAHLGVGANAGDFRIQGSLLLNLNKLGSLHVDAVNQLYSPSAVQNQLFISSKEVWKKDFDRTLETSLSGTYSLPTLKFSATGTYFLVSNLVYFDSLAQPRQSDAFSVFQLIFRKNFRLGSFNLENWVGLQQATSDVLAVPDVFTKHSLYFQKKIFRKVMLAKMGVDARINTGYKAPSFHPLIGQFYLQDQTELPFTPLLDVFLSFQVKTFRFFYKIENVLPFLTKDYYYQTAAYPLPFGLNNGGSRFGISWRLVE